MKRTKMIIALFLSALMFFSVVWVCFAASVSPNQVLTDRDVYFYVPECVYLNYNNILSSINACYLNSYSDKDDSVINAWDKSGHFYFHREGASNITVTVNGAFFNDDEGSLSTIPPTFTALGDTVSKEFKVLSDKYADGLLQFTVAYTYNGETRTAKSYTYVYAADRTSFGSAKIGGFSYSPYPNDSTYYFVSTQLQPTWGVHTIIDNDSDTNSGALEGLLLLGDSIKAADGFDFPTYPNTLLRGFLSTDATPKTYALSINNSGQGNSNTNPEILPTYKLDLCETSPNGLINVDLSRFSNLKDVPFLSSGFVIGDSRTTESKYLVSTMYSMSVARGRITGLGGNTGNLINESFIDEGWYGVVSDGTSIDCSLDNIPFGSAQDFTVTTFLKTWFSEDFYVRSYCHNVITVINNDKSSLREMYLNELKKGYQANDFSEDDAKAFKDYSDSMKEAAICLGDPRASKESILSAEAILEKGASQFGEKYDLVVLGTSSGDYTLSGFINASKTIKAGTKTGYDFSKWVFVSDPVGNIADPFSPETEYTFGSANAQIMALWTARTYADPEGDNIVPGETPPTYGEPYEFDVIVPEGYSIVSVEAVSGDEGTDLNARPNSGREPYETQGGEAIPYITDPVTGPVKVSVILEKDGTNIYYDLVFETDDGILLDEITYGVEHGTPVGELGINTDREADDKYEYSFKGWAPDTVTGNGKYIAEYERNSHTYDEGALVREATCVEEGLKMYTCTSCGYIMYVTQPKDTDNHLWSDREIIEPPTCTQSGFSRKVCLRGCGAEISYGIEPTGHHDGDGDGYCDECGEKTEGTHFIFPNMRELMRQIRELIERIREWLKNGFVKPVKLG